MLETLPTGRRHDEDGLIRYLAEGTAPHTGADYFEALVRHLAAALDVAGAWVTELSPDGRKLRAYSFWLNGGYLPEYEYEIPGTPCEAVIQSRELVHISENVIRLFPADPDLVAMNAVSFLGIPLLDADGSVLGHLAAIDVKPLAMTARVEAILKIFGARAAAEARRLRSEARIRDRERQLSTLFDSAWDAILVIDETGRIRHANQSCAGKFEVPADDLAGADFAGFLTEASRARWREQFAALGREDAGRRLWIGDLQICASGGAAFPAEASLSGFERDGEILWTLILRDLHEQREAERRLAALTEESRCLREELEDLRPVGQLIGESPVMRTLFSQVRQVSATNATVLILGETGTGKELVARAIHEASPRRCKPLVRLNCGAIPAALMESEFFGHEKGSFTGATERREGRFAIADGGTLFLDEVGELPLDLQVKLLRVLQEGEFEPVGSSRTRKVDVRIVAATHRDLAAEVERGRFRADLYYRLNVFPVTVPPLRCRGADIEHLADSFVQRFAAQLNRTFRPLSRAARQRLCAYSWPGNVRELENVLERAAILARGDELVLDERLLPAAVPSSSSPPAAPATGAVLTARQFEELERENMVRALETCSWRVAGESGAARMLGLAPSTLTSRMKSLGIVRDRAKAPDSVS